MRNTIVKLMFGQFSTSLLEIYDFNSNQWQLRNSQQDQELSDFMLDGSSLIIDHQRQKF